MKERFEGKKVSNVALPSSCTGDDFYLSVKVDKPSARYRIFVCNGKVKAERQEGSKWVSYKSYDPKDHAGVSFFSVRIDGEGKLSFPKVG